MAELISQGVDERLLATRGIRLLANESLISSAEYAEFLEDSRGVADGSLKAAIEQDTRDYGVVDGIADSDARAAAIKKEQRGVLMYTVLVALLYCILIMCSRGAFGQLIVSWGSFGPLAGIFLAVAFIGCFGFLALNLLRSYSAADRVSALRNDIDANSDALERYLLQLVEFADRKGQVFEELAMSADDKPLAQVGSLAFSSGRAPAAFYMDPQLMDRLGRYAGRLVVFVPLVTSAFGFMGTMFVDGDTFTKLDVVMAILIGGMTVMLLFGDDAHPGSAKSIRTWLFSWILPIVIEFFLWGIVTIAQLLSIFGFIVMLIGFGICAFFFYLFLSA